MTDSKADSVHENPSRFDEAPEGMDLLLVHCEAGISPLPFIGIIPALGLIDLASYLKSRGFDVGIIDARHSDFAIDWFADFIVAAKPRWIGFDVLADTVFTVARLMHIVREHSPSTRIMVGGPQATVASEDILLHLEPDVVVRGEGELTCVEILSGNELADMRGITFRDGDATRTNPHQPLLDLDDLPTPDYSLVWKYDTMGFYPCINTGRGCPYKCTFCAAPTLGPKLRWRSIDKVISDIRIIMKTFPTKYLSITDDTFTFNKKRTRAFCKAIRKIGGGRDFFWFAEGRVDRLAGEKRLMKRMKKAGLVMLQLGIESGDERVLESYKKNISLMDARRVTKDLADVGILIHAGFIVGGPFESRKTLATTLDFMKEITEISGGLMQIKIAYLNPLPKTDIYEHPDKYGLLICDRDLHTSGSFDNAVTETHGLSREDIFRARVEMQTEIAKLHQEVFNRHEQKHLDYLKSILEKIGAIHIALGFLSGIDIEAQRTYLSKMIFDKAHRYKQFFTFGHEHSLELIPARMIFFNMDENGRYFNNLTGEKLSDVESDVLNYACGKLSGTEIAYILELDDEEMRRALKGLEDKKMIIHRTY